MRSILDPADVVAAPQVRARGRRLSPAPDEDDVVDYDRNGAGLLIDDWTILDVEVKMWPQRVARVTYSGYLLPNPHALSLAHPRASLLEVRHDRVAMVADLEGNVVAIRGRLPELADGLVRVDVAHAYHRAVRRSQHGLAEAVPGLSPPRIALVATPLSVEPHEV